MDNLNIIVKMKFGSKLYGTDTPESDTDYKGVFLPTAKEVLLNRIPKSYNYMTKQNKKDKNSSEDMDIEFYSLHHFIKLACEGQTVAMDMIHAPDHMIEEKTDIWDLIVNNRKKLYTKKMKAFVGYAKRQMEKHGVSSDRLGNLNKIIKQLIMFRDSKKCHETKLKDIWDDLPDLEFTRRLYDEKSKLRMYKVIDRKFQETISIDYMLDCLIKTESTYGNRIRKAEENQVDFKALSHALRTAYQMRELLIDNTITFPLKNASFIKEVKQGKHDYLTVVAPVLENLFSEVEELIIDSDLPESVDAEYWDGLLMFIIGDNVLNMYT